MIPAATVAPATNRNRVAFPVEYHESFVVIHTVAAAHSNPISCKTAISTEYVHNNLYAQEVHQMFSLVTAFLNSSMQYAHVT